MSGLKMAVVGMSTGKKPGIYEMISQQQQMK